MEIQKTISSLLFSTSMGSFENGLLTPREEKWLENHRCVVLVCREVEFFSFFKVESKDRVAALFFPLSFSSGVERLARPRLPSSSCTPMIFGNVASQPRSLNPPARVSRL